MRAQKQATGAGDPLRQIPGVGQSIAEDFRQLGIRRVDDLRGQDPEKLYARLQLLQGGPVDRCMLYVMRCAVYFASEKRRDPERLKWWNWKDRQVE
jgi:hypothetical protein